MTIGNLSTPEEIAPGNDPSDSYSLVNARTVIDGTVTTETDLQVDGQLTGQLQCRGVLYITEGARVDATVDAGGIVVEGALSGTIRCRGRLEIRPSGSVSGEVDTERLVIFEGAIYEGRLRMEQHAPKIVEPASEVEAVPPAQAQPNPYSYLRSTAPASTVTPSDAQPASSDDDDDEENTDARR